MQHTTRHRRNSPQKRHTWPRLEASKLETIPESPRTPPCPSPQPVVTLSGNDADSLTAKEQCPQIGLQPDARAQMIWWSHHLKASQQDRDRLSQKIKYLEAVCKSQTKTNACLMLEIKSWRSSYDVIEAELLEAAQEIEEAKAYVRNIEAANANLKYALAQAKQGRENARQSKWRTTIAKCLRSLSSFIRPVKPDAVGKATKLGSSKA